jgi:hypothetical protein
MNETTYDNKCAILSQVWLDFRDDENFAQFMSYGDLGLPLAYAIDAGIIGNTPEAETLVVEVFDLLLGILGVEEDTGFDTLDDILFEDKED